MKDSIRNKKLLVLGGKPLGACEIVQYAKAMGIYTIVADYLPPESSPAKRIAHEYWDISTADLDKLEKRSREKGIDGVVASVHEFNIEMSIKLAERLGLPTYCTLEQWELCAKKDNFKRLCRDYGLPVAKEYIMDGFLENNKVPKELVFPAITKPVDSSGSRGFSICRNAEELHSGYNKALDNSKTGKVLVEEYIEHESSVVVLYYLLNGEIHFSGMCDKYPRSFDDRGSYVSGLQIYPSIYTKNYFDEIDNKVRYMFKNIGLKEGPIWIEIFIKSEEFFFNEMGYRFGGSLTFYPVKALFGYNQLARFISFAISGEYNAELYTLVNSEKFKNICTLPIHVRPGKIKKIVGVQDLLSQLYVINLAQLHYEGEVISNWATAQQVFSYLHFGFNDIIDLREKACKVFKLLKAFDIEGNNMLFTLFDIDNDQIKLK